MIERAIEPPEPKEKYYTLTCNCTCKVEIGIWAENQEHAEEQINDGDYVEINLLSHDVEDVLNVSCDE